MRKIVQITLLFLAVAAAGLSAGAPCLDNNITGKRLMDQQAAYEAERDKVVSMQEASAPAEELIPGVKAEAPLATKSWVRAAIYCYLGLLYEQVAALPDAINAYKTAASYAKAAVKFTKDPRPDKVIESQTQGAKYKAIAEKALARLVKK